MLEETIYSLGAPGTFDITDKTDPLYYIARFSHEMSQNFYNLQTEGFVWRQDESSDIASIISDFDTYATSLESWFTSAVAASNDDLPIPAPPSVPALPGSPLLGIILSVLVRILIRIFVDWLRKKLDPATEALEIARVLKKALLKQGPTEEYSLVELLANTPLEIILSRIGEYQDYLYSDRPLT